jgi:apolipoprotein N-acyltransferase
LKIDRFPWWLLGAVLYGISWPMPWNVNLSFLAWFALVFLFISLEKAKGFWRFFGIAWSFTFISYTICSGWFLNIPTNKILIIIGAVTESFSFPLPFIPYYFIKKRAGFNKSIFILPFLFAVGEWVYCSLEHNLSYLLVAHSQTANLWLIQCADTFGYLFITFWVVLFNVILYSALIRSEYRPLSPAFLKRAVPFALVMVSLPLCYALVRNRQIKREKSDSISITMIHTCFAPRPDSVQVIKNLDRTVELTDSTDYYATKKGIKSDLYVWHEGAIPSGNNRHIRSFVAKAVQDWQVPLLSGMQYLVRFGDTGFWQPVNRVVLFPVRPDSADPLPFYDKIHLAPGWESIPYLSLFHKLGIRFVKEYKYHKMGERLRLFEVPVRDRKVLIGTPICFEQNAPALWNRMILLGADCFVQVSFESWFGKTYFQKQVAYITRLRAIETRHGVARCSNGGLTFFTDAFGRITSQATGPESTVSDSVTLSKTVTFYTRHQNLFPLMCLVVSTVCFIFVICRRRSKSEQG